VLFISNACGGGGCKEYLMSLRPVKTRLLDHMEFVCDDVYPYAFENIRKNKKHLRKMNLQTTNNRRQFLIDV